MQWMDQFQIRIRSEILYIFCQQLQQQMKERNPTDVPLSKVSASIVRLPAAETTSDSQLSGAAHKQREAGFDGVLRSCGDKRLLVM